MGNLEQSLNKFAKRVVKESKANLNKFNRTDTKKLQGSIGYDLKISKNSFSLLFSLIVPLSPNRNLLVYHQVKH